MRLSNTFLQVVAFVLELEPRAVFFLSICEGRDGVNCTTSRSLRRAGNVEMLTEFAIMVPPGRDPQELLDFLTSDAFLSNLIARFLLLTGIRIIAEFTRLPRLVGIAFSSLPSNTSGSNETSTRAASTPMQSTTPIPIDLAGLLATTPSPPFGTTWGPDEIMVICIGMGALLSCCMITSIRIFLVARRTAKKEGLNDDEQRVLAVSKRTAMSSVEGIE